MLLLQVKGLIGGLDAVDLLTVCLSLFGGALAAWAVSWRETRIRRTESKEKENEERRGLLLLVRHEIESNQDQTRDLKKADFSRFVGIKKMKEQIMDSIIEEREAENRPIDEEVKQRFFHDPEAVFMQTVTTMEEARLSLAHLYRTHLATAFNTSVWEGVRVRLAQLMPAQELDTLLSYYAEVEAQIPVLQALTDEKVIEAIEDSHSDSLNELADKLLEKGEKAEAIASARISKSSAGTPLSKIRAWHLQVGG